MASTQKKSSNSGKKTSSAKKAEPKKEPAKKEKRSVYTPNLPARGVGAAVCVFLAVLLVLGMTGTSAVVVDFLCKGIKGLVGYGVWAAIPGFVVAAVLLVLVREKPVRGRLWCLVIFPIFLGAFVHMLISPFQYEMGLSAFSALFQDGIALHSGGVVGGFLGISCATWFSKIGAGLILGIVMLFLVAAVFRLTPARIARWNQSRRDWGTREYDGYEDDYDDRYDSGSYDRYDDYAGGGRESLPAASDRRERSRFGLRTGRRKQAIDVPGPDKPGQEEMPTPFEAPAVAVPPMTVQTASSTEKSSARTGRGDPSSSRKPVGKPDLPVQTAPPLDAAPLSEKAKTKARRQEDIRQEAAQVDRDIRSGREMDARDYVFPSLELLSPPSGETAQAAHQELEGTLERLSGVLISFGIDGHVTGAVQGPSVTRYEVALEQGVRLNKLTNLSDDVALALGVSSVRLAPVPGKISVVGIEVPNKVVTPVPIREVLDSPAFRKHKSSAAFSVGKDIGGNYIVGDCSKLPHLLIAGTTGSGKSVCINSLLVSILYKSTPDEVRLIMVDPMMVELGGYNGIPHLLIPVVTDPKKAAGALQWAVVEMMKRYRLFAEAGVRELSSYNLWAKGQDNAETMPKIIIVIDELADLMLVAAKEVEESICRVAQMGRAAGMHLVIATQRPSADVITGLMKANIPSRVAFAVASSLESRIILDNTGAEKLVGKGDMLWYPLGSGKPLRVQGCFISDEEVAAVAAAVKQNCTAAYDDDVMEQIEQHAAETEKKGKGAFPAGDGAEEQDELFPAAVDVVLDLGQASASMLQRRLKLGYARAARLLDQMEQKGVIGPSEGAKPRQILVTREQWNAMQNEGESPGGEEPAPAMEDEILTFDPLPQSDEPKE